MGLGHQGHSRCTGHNIGHSIEHWTQHGHSEGNTATRKDLNITGNSITISDIPILEGLEILHFLQQQFAESTKARKGRKGLKVFHIGIISFYCIP